jgi:hypothetical protein
VIKKLVKGLGLQGMFGKIERGGKPEGERSYTREEFLRDAPMKFLEYVEAEDREPSQGRLAANMDISTSLFKQYRREYGLPWPPIRKTQRLKVAKPP